MYDRKTWIVVSACSVLLAVNMYFTQKNARERAAAEAANPPAIEQAGEAATEEPGVLREVDPEPSPARQTYTLETEGSRFTFTSLGGSLLSSEMLGFPAVGDAEHNVTLNGGDSYGIGTLCQGPDGMEQVDYRLLSEESVEGKKLVFGAQHPSGVLVRKTWELTDTETEGAAYRLNFRLDIENPKAATEQIPLDRFSLYLGRSQPLQKGEGGLNPAGFFLQDDGDFDLTKSSAFRGGKIKKAKSLIQKSTGNLGMAGVSSQFFATVLRPTETVGGGVWAKSSEVEVIGEDSPQLAVRAGLVLPSDVLTPGSGIKSLSYEVFTGPKNNRLLRRMGGDWGEVMNYGWFTVFSRFMNFLLVHVHDVVSKVSDKWSWGFAIIIVTLLVRAAMWPLYARSNRTMKRMSKLKPEMDKIKEKYPDDPAKQQQETMQLYRKFHINPVGGCLPMFAQIPIFFGFYRMLQYAVELRGHEFLWVNDLSQPDTIAHIAGFPINVLPILMGISSFLQMQMTPNVGGDKTQQMVMKIMPLMFLFFCYNFASALALYWTTSNLFSIAQTWITKRMPEPELKEREVKKGGKSFMERMAAAAEEAQKQQKLKQAKGRVVESDPNPDKPRKPRGPKTGG